MPRWNCITGIPRVESSARSVDRKPCSAEIIVTSTLWKGGRKEVVILGVKSRTRDLKEWMGGMRACVIAIVCSTFAFSASDQSSGWIVSTGPEG